MLDLNFKIDIRGLDKFTKNINDGANINVVCGVPENEQYEDGTSVAEVALINEYGLTTGSIEHPPRPFLSETLKSNKKKYARMMDGAIAGIPTGQMDKSVLQEVGREMEQDIKLAIDNWSPCDPRPNTKNTIARKNAKNGSGEMVLVDSGKLKESIRWWIDTRSR